MFTTQDEALFAQKGISQEQVEAQINKFKTGFPFLEIKSAAAVGNGIMAIDNEELYLNEWEQYLAGEHKIVKFVPASGAASRMFKDLFEYADSTDKAQNKFIAYFFENIKNFAFYADLDAVCTNNNGKNIAELMQAGEHKNIIKNLLLVNGLNYGSLPKGLLKFHNYADAQRTPALEHLVEGKLYANTKNNVVNIHFTVSSEHRALFEAHIAENAIKFEQEFGVKFDISFSAQKPSTDTVAVDGHNEPFRENDKILFRPGGHGALIENLNDIDSDVIFVKNIDNVVPDKFKAATVTYKKLIAGVLVNLQKQAFAYLNELENSEISDAKLAVIRQFCENKLNNHSEAANGYSKEELINYLRNKLNRPMRVCGMVKNVGEPGGGPFLTVNADGTVSPQILESSQIANAKLMEQSTHFNPVDLVCGVRNYKGEKFDLTAFVDEATGFISEKSKNGKELKALELPGLWNGAMSDWNTIFVEVPIETFNPVKTVNDLLRTEHQ